MSSARKSTYSGYPVSKLSAVGPGLIQGQTNVQCHFTIYTGYFPGKDNKSPSFQGYKLSPLLLGAQSAKGIKDPRDEIDFQIEGPSEPGPLSTDANDDDGSLDVTWTPLLRGEYKINVKLGGKHIDGSPFSVTVTGESIRAHTLASRVQVTGDGLKKGVVGKMNRVRIELSDKGIAGGLGVAIGGPPKAHAKLDLKDHKDGTFDLTYRPDLVGTYQLHIKIADSNIPGSPFNIQVAKV